MAVALLIAAILAVYFAVVPPAADAPLNDDWAYAQSVQHLLATGELHVSEAASPSLVPQIFVGALFSRLAGGFSFVNLRWSTLLCAVISCLAFYDLLRQLGLRHAEGMLGVLLLLVNPIFINLTYTFMSDIFFLALLLLSLTCYARGFQRRSHSWLLIGSIVAACAYLERQLGLLLPVGVGLAWLLRERRWAWRPLLLIGVMPGLAILGHLVWLKAAGTTWAAQVVATRTTDFLATPGSLVIIVMRVLSTAMYLGIFTLPVLAAWLISRRSLRSTRRQVKLFVAWLIILGMSSMVFVVTNHIGFPQLSNIIDQAGLGAITLPGAKPAPISTGWLWGITLLAPFAGAVQATLWTEAVILWQRERGSLSTGLIIVSGAMFLATILFAFFFDRYLLVLVPCAAYLILRRRPLSRLGRLAAVMISVAFMTYNIVGMNDYLAWTAARWNAAEALVAQGIAPKNIDGGAEWVYWYEFETALPLARAAGQDNDIFAWMHMTPKEYLLSFEPMAGYSVMSDVRYSHWPSSQSGHIYILRRE